MDNLRHPTAAHLLNDLTMGTGPWRSGDLTVEPPGPKPQGEIPKLTHPSRMPMSEEINGRELEDAGGRRKVTAWFVWRLDQEFQVFSHPAFVDCIPTLRPTRHTLMLTSPYHNYTMLNLTNLPTYLPPLTTSPLCGTTS